MICQRGLVFFDPNAVDSLSDKKFKLPKPLMEVRWNARLPTDMPLEQQRHFLQLWESVWAAANYPEISVRQICQEVDCLLKAVTAAAGVVSPSNLTYLASEPVEAVSCDSELDQFIYAREMAARTIATCLFTSKGKASKGVGNLNIGRWLRPYFKGPTLSNALVGWQLRDLCIKGASGSTVMFDDWSSVFLAVAKSSGPVTLVQRDVIPATSPDWLYTSSRYQSGVVTFIVFAGQTQRGMLGIGELSWHVKSSMSTCIVVFKWQAAIHALIEVAGVAGLTFGCLS
jgi:hypothetical protein